MELYGCDYPTPDGTCIRDDVHVADVATPHVAALHRLQAGDISIICDVGAGEGASNRAVISAVEAAAGRTASVMRPDGIGEANKDRMSQHARHLQRVAIEN